MVWSPRIAATLPRRIVMLPLLAALILGWTAQYAVRAGNSDPWTVVEVYGAALVSHDGAGWQPLRTGDVLRPGSRMKTGKDGRAVLKRPGDSLAVSPGSSFGIPNGPEKRPLGSIVQSLGTLLFKVKTRPQDPFKVKTPFLAAVIRGTTFTVSVNARNAALHVAKGAVEVTSVLSGETVLVRPGETAVVDLRAGGALKLVGRGNQNRQTRIKKSGKGAAITRRADASNIGSSEAGRKPSARLANITGSSSGPAGKAAASSGRTHYVITRRLGDHRVSISRLTKGLVSDGSRRGTRKKSKGKGKNSGSGRSTTSTNSDSGGSITSIDSDSGGSITSIDSGSGGSITSIDSGNSGGCGCSNSGGNSGGNNSGGNSGGGS